MKLNERQYERVAQWLDGRDVRLDAAERAFADELRRDERAVFAALPAAVPSGAIDRARRRMIAASAARRRPRWAYAGLAAAAAAAVLTAILLRPAGERPVDGPVAAAPAAATLSAQMLLAATEQALSADEIDLISREMDELAADMTVGSGALSVARIGMMLDVLEREIDEFDLYYDPPDGWMQG